MSKLAVVFGGSGFVGRHVVRELAKRGWRVRVAVRRPHLASFLLPLGSVGQIQLAQSNIRMPDSIAAALDGADAVVNLVGILANHGAQNFSAVHEKGTADLARLCAEAGIENVVHISTMGASSESPSAYGRSKKVGEAAMRDTIPTATIMRPSIIFGAGDDFFNRFAGMMVTFRSVPLIGGGHTKFQPVYVDDVADAICAALENQKSRGKEYALAGPQVKSFKELMQLTAKIIDRKCLLVPVPFALAGFMGLSGDIINFLSMGLVNAPITSDQVKMLKIDNVLANEPDGINTLKDLNITPETMEAILPTYLYRFRKYGQFTELTS